LDLLSALFYHRLELLGNFLGCSWGSLLVHLVHEGWQAKRACQHDED
jgi:hypothetical protein